MKVFKLIFKNALRHKLRTFLTVLGIAVAIMAFGILRTVVTSWDVGIEATSANRLITRQAVSFIFPLPYSYKEKIQQIEGIKTVSFANWFQGVYIDKNQFFSRLSVDAETIFDVYPEFVLPKEQQDAFKKQRNACIVGIDLAKKYNLKIGDMMVLDGDIYPGRWEFEIKGIYQKRDKVTDGSQMFFHWKLVDERMRLEGQGREGEIGWYIIKISDPNKSGEISAKIDNLFKNSTAETKTETERAFAQGFMSSTSAIIVAMDFMSFVIVGIIMLVLGNTMIMAARERTREWAVFKTLGFSAFHLIGLILGESLLVAFLGGGFGIFLTFPIIAGFEEVIPKAIFPAFQLAPVTIILAISSAIFIGIASAIFPIQKALRTKIVDGFRFVG